MTIETPFRRQISPATYTKRSRGTLASYKHKLNTFVEVPSLVFPCVWRGASEIVAKLNFTIATNLSFFDNVPLNPDYCAVISWRVDSNTIARYKLWEDVGEILYLDLYNGQTIGSEPSIEIWNTKDSLFATIEGFRLKTSELIIPSCSCDNDDHVVALAWSQCTDNTFNLVGFNPSIGDYYLVIGCGITELIHASALSKLTVKCVDDNTWHDVTLVTFGGITTIQIDQAPTLPGTKDWFPFLVGGLSYGLELTLFGGIYTYFLTPVIDSSATAFIQLLSTDANYYLVWSDGITIEINQTPV